MTRYDLCFDDEMFIGNTSDTKSFAETFDGVIDYRFGDQAYSINGDKLDGDYTPIFVKKKDLAKYNSIRERQLSDIRSGRA